MIRARLVLGGGPRVDRFSAPHPIEMVARLSVADYASGSTYANRVRMAHVLVPGCRIGDILQVDFACEVSNKLPYNVELAGYLFWTKSPTGIAGDIFTGHSGRAFNISPNMHHGIANFSDVYQIQEDGDGYVAAMIYAGGGSTSQPGDSVPVELGYGDLEVVRIRRQQ